MTWILIGTLLGSTVISYHDSEEACKGRLIMLIGKGVIGGQCIPNSITPAIPYGNERLPEYGLWYQYKGAAPLRDPNCKSLGEHTNAMECE